MSFRVAGLIWVIAALPALSQPPIPADHFVFDHMKFHSGRFGDRFTDNERLQHQVREALLSPDRDDQLERLLGSVSIAGEKWFDLRGLEIIGDDGERRTLDLRRTCLDFGRLQNVDLRDASLSGVLLRGVIFDSVDLRGADLGNARLDCSIFRSSDLSGANFRVADFGAEGRLIGCKLDGTRFDHSQGLVRIDGCYGDGVSFFGASLANLILTGGELNRVDFRGSDLRKADFHGSALVDANFTDADLSFARLGGARLGGRLRFLRTRLEEPFFGDIDFKEMELGYLRWVNGKRLGEEVMADRMVAQSNTLGEALQIERLYSQAESIYRGLFNRYLTLGYRGEAREMKFRSREVRLKLLRRYEARTLERYLLSLSKMWDGFGTRADLLLFNYLLCVSAFAAFYFTGSILSRKSWLRYERTLSLSEFVSVEEPRSPRRRLELADTVPNRIWVGLRVGLLVWLFSLECSLLFARRVLDVRELGDYFRARPYRLEAYGFGRYLVGVESMAGLCFFAAFTRHFVELVAI